MTVELPPRSGLASAGRPVDVAQPYDFGTQRRSDDLEPRPGPAASDVDTVRQALAAGEFVLEYQPQFATRSGEVEAAEALVRWARPGSGLLQPGSFLPLLRGSAALDDLTEWIVGQAVRQLRAWRDVGLSLSVAVNIAPETLARADVVAMVDVACRRVDVPESSLLVEITEDVLADDAGRALRQLVELRRRGVRIALDDFGVGGASLSRLRDLPIDQIKLDGHFVGRCAEDPRDLAIVRTVKDLADRFAIQSVAECVEDEKTRELLSELGYDLLQGYGLCRPCGPEQIADLGSTRSLAAAAMARRAREQVVMPDGTVVGDSPERRAAAEAILCDAVGTAYTELASLAVELTECPQARISLLTDVEAVIGEVGPVREAGLLTASPAALVLSAPDGLVHVRDAWSDARTRLLPEVQEPMAVRFLAAAAVRSPRDGQLVGAVTVLDHRPRVLSVAQRRGLQRLAGLVADRLLLASQARVSPAPNGIPAAREPHGGLDTLRLEY